MKTVGKTWRLSGVWDMRKPEEDGGGTNLVDGGERVDLSSETLPLWFLLPFQRTLTSESGKPRSTMQLVSALNSSNAPKKIARYTKTVCNPFKCF